MKKYIHVTFIVLILLCSVTAYAQPQNKTITGTVSDEGGTLPGVSIVEKGAPSNGVITNVNGKFTLTLKGVSNTIEVRFVGYSSKEIKITDFSKPLDISMEVSTQGLEEVVVVGFGTKTRITNTGAVSSISAEKIKNIPTSSIQNTLAGRVPGFFSQQRSGQPGRDASDFFIRGVSSLNGAGNTPLIIVDDIEYNYAQLAQINVNEIESISILKDASTTAIYGIKGANGVLIVKTRRGQLGDPKVTVRVEGGMQSAVKKPTFLNAYNTALLRNEALSNDGLSPQFSNNDVELFRTGNDKWGHPDVNWYDEVFKPSSFQANTNIDIAGGTPRTKYFISGGAWTQNGAMRDFASADREVNSNYFYKRYTFRSNLDVEATKTLSLRLDVTGRFGEINSPAAASNIMGDLYNYEVSNPYGAPFLNPNGSYAYNRYSSNYMPTVNARLATRGYNRDRNNDFNILLEANQSLEAITPGLSVKGRLAYASSYTINRGLYRFDNPPVYLYDPETNTHIRPPNGRFVLSNFVLTAGNSFSEKIVNLQGFLNYDRTFGKHHVYSLLLFNQNTKRNDAYLPSEGGLPVKYRGYSLRVGYEFDQKYLFDFNIAYNGTDRFLKAYGYFPAGSIGWNISKESFLEDVKFINLLKLRASYGMVGSDISGGSKYLFQQFYDRGGVYALGVTNVNNQALVEGALPNPNVVWEKQRQFDVGIDFNAFNDKLAVTFDYFNNFRYDQLFTRSSMSQIIGVGLPQENIAKVRNTGFDGQINYRPNIGKLQLDFGFVFSYAKNKIVYMDEPYLDMPELRRTGRSLGQPFGYTWIGFYKDEEDIANSPKVEGAAAAIRPGDLKYKDLNGDGLINQYDMGAIGKPNLQNLTMGLPIGINYKKFSASILFQGSFNYSLILNSSAIEPFQSQMQPIHQLRWTPQTADVAKFPRLTTIRNTVNSPNASAFPSNFWLINAQFIRLKTVELGYQFPKEWLPFKINSIRMYLTAYNLLTWTNYSLYQQDPEVASNTVGDSYLNQRAINLGLQIGL